MVQINHYPPIHFQLGILALNKPWTTIWRNRLNFLLTELILKVSLDLVSPGQGTCSSVVGQGEM